MIKSAENFKLWKNSKKLELEFFLGRIPTQYDVIEFLSILVSKDKVDLFGSKGE